MTQVAGMTPVARRQRPRRQREGGFALLLVFVFAAAVAFAIYQELPRAAFESARDKEQLLIDRGKQYERAIEVYYAVNKRFPAELKDLEDTNQKRYLRRRYKDPLTGQDEWRLIHTNGSFLTDSLVQKPPAQNAGNGAPGGSTVGGGPLGSNTMNTVATPAASDTTNAAPAVNAAAQRRPSDRTFTPGGFPQPANPQAASPFGPGPGNFDPNDPRTWPPITLATPNAQPGQPNAPRPGQQPNTQITAGQIGAGQIGLGQNNIGQQQFPPPIQPQINPRQGFGAAFGPQTGIPNLGNGVPAAPNQTQQVIPDPLNQNQNNQNQFNPNQQNQFNPNQQNQFNPSQQNQFNPSQQNQFNPNQQNQFNPNQQNQFNPNQQNQFNPNPFNQNQVSVNQGGQVVPQVNQFPQPMPNGGQQPQVGGLNAAAGGNAALQAINDQLFRPNQGAAAPAGATGSPGIAGVASKHEGPSIKSYRERTKYQEWEFVFDPSAKNPIQPAGPGQNPLGQNPPGGQNPLGGQNPMGQNPLGQSQPGQAQPGMTNPFSQPNPFSPQSGAPGNPGR
jgi:hypothetical protein